MPGDRFTAKDFHHTALAWKRYSESSIQNAVIPVEIEAELYKLDKAEYDKRKRK